MKFLGQVWLVLQKNFLLLKGQKFWLFMWVCAPLVLFLLLWGVRAATEAVEEDTCYYDAKALPTAGVLPFWQSQLCSLGNDCNEAPTSGDDSLQLGRGARQSAAVEAARALLVGVLSPRLNDSHLPELADSVVALGTRLARLDPASAVQSASALMPEWTRLSDALTASGVTHMSDELQRFVRIVYSLANTSATDTSATDKKKRWQLIGDLLTCNRIKEPRARWNKFLRLVASGQPPKDSSEEHPQSEDDAASTPEPAKSGSCLNGRLHVEAKQQCQFYDDIWHGEGADLRAVVRGYILVSPRSPVVDRLVALMDKGLVAADSLRHLAIDLIHNADKYLAAVDGSDFLAALSNGAEMLNEVQTLLNARHIDVSDLRSLLNDSAARSKLLSGIGKFGKLLNDSGLPGLLDCVNLRGRFVVVADEREMEETALCLQHLHAFHAGIVFDVEPGAATLPRLTAYKLRMAQQLVDSTRTTRDKRSEQKARDRPNEHLKYLSFGFSFLQDSVDAAIIRLHTGALPPVGLYAQQHPHRCYKGNNIEQKVAVLVPVIMMLSWIVPTTLICKALVYEKELRLKEFMRVMGLRNSVHLLASFIHSFTVSSVPVVAIVLIGKLAPVWEYTAALLLFLLVTAYVCSLITQAFLISTLFDRANMATAATPFIVIFCYLPFAVVTADSYVAKLFACLLTQSAFGYGVQEMGVWESAQIGLQWSNLASGASEESSFDLLTCFGMLIFDSILYVLLAVYVDTVFPGQYGVPKPFYFPLQPSYWKGHSMEGREAVGAEDIELGASSFEPAPPDAKEGVVVKRMSKRYKDGTRAVDELSITFYESQISSFLGHNGAGKTTTMSILTGLHTPSSGSAFVNGRNIYTEMDEIRDSLGYCPQHNILYEKLSVREQVNFYAGLKGVPSKERRAVVDAIIADVGLTKKADNLADTLSGGMKRKLSVAIAFVGHSKTVVLDEPTAGVDPFARRDIWDLLLKYKPGRTIILSTHHMDEADALGDRIAILAKGRLVCAGSSLFLKHRQGTGFRLRIVLDRQAFAAANADADPESHARLVEESCAAELAGTTRMAASGAELLMALPRVPADQLQAFFDQLEGRRAQLCVESYGLSDTSLEDVFLTFVQAHEGDDGGGRTTCRCFTTVRRWLAPLVRRSNADEKASANGVELLEEPVNRGEGERDAVEAQPTGRLVEGCFALCLRRFIALVIKRAHNFRRNLRGMFAETLLPVMLMALASYLASIGGDQRIQPPLVMSPWIYDKPTFFSSKSNRDLASADYGDHMLRWPGLGSVCVRPELKLPSAVDCPRDARVEYPSPPPNAKYSVNAKCSCPPVRGECEVDAFEPPPSDALLPTGDTLVDLSGRDISEWLVMTQRLLGYHRIGGYSFAVENERATVRVSGDEGAARFGLLSQLWSKVSAGLRIHWNSSLQFPDDTSTDIGRYAAENLEARDTVKVWFNNKAWISQPAMTNALNNIILRAGVTSSEGDDYAIRLTNHPMKAPPLSRLEQNKSDVEQQASLTILWLLAFSMIPASFVLSLIEERVSHAKHLQCVSGAPVWLYWLAALAWDLINFLLPIALVVIVFFVFDARVYTSHIGATILLLLLYAFAVVPLMYLFTFVFDTPPYAFVALMFINFFVGIITAGIMAILDLVSLLASLGKQQEGNFWWYTVFDYLFAFFPQLHLAYGMLTMVFMEYFSQGSKSPWDWNVLGKRYVSLFISGVAYFCFVLFIEYRSTICGVCRRRQVEKGAVAGEDSDVMAERALDRPHLDQGLMLKNLVKVYGGRRSLVAVDGLTVGVAKGECFGLLGVNGAGKTTVFNMITGKIRPTSGDAVFHGESVLTNLPAVHKLTGYCPQFDALSGRLSGREQLAFYARLRGICEADIGPVVDWAIRYMNLSAWATQLSRNYSGGNKRKLSTAIALVGSPEFVLLDEPSTGMDPGTRRFLWDRVTDLRTKHARTVVLTSHSMEECEALCSRAGIMVDGRLQCVGSVQHLKDKFGGGYSLKLKLASDPPADAEAIVGAELGDGAELVARHHTTMQYRLAANDLSGVFACLQRVGQRVPIEDYALSQTTLDDVFIKFASLQNRDTVEPHADGSLPAVVIAPAARNFPAAAPIRL